MNYRPTTQSPEQRSLFALLVSLSALLAATGLVALCVGRYPVPPLTAVQILLGRLFAFSGDWPDTMVSVISLIRLPRVIAAILVAGALALAGATYQGIFRNPLVSPDLLGVSGGACVGAALAILLGLGTVGTQILAFVGGIVAVLMTTAIPRFIRRENNSVVLVLAGVIVGGVMSSIIGLLKYLADTETQLPDIVYWQLGSLARVTYSNLYAIGPVMLVSGALLVAMRWRINVLSLGDREARALGVDLRRERGIAIVCSTLLTASAVCLAGTIGWIGLVMPHLARGLVGSDNARVFPVTILLSASFLLLIDTLARSLTGGEIPLGILTGLFGAPFFALVLARERGAV